MAEEELTERESRRNLTLFTLEDTVIQNTLGATIVSNIAEYGKRGERIAKNSFNTEELKQAKENKYKELLQEYERNGITRDPSYAFDDGYFSNEKIQGLEQLMKVSYLEDLAEGVNKIAPELGFKLPEKLKGYAFNELVKKGAEEKDGQIMVNSEKLSAIEQDALETYSLLRKAYRDAAIKKVMNKYDYFGDVKEPLNAIMEKYNPTPKEPENKGGKE